MYWSEENGAKEVLRSVIMGYKLNSYSIQVMEVKIQMTFILNQFFFIYGLCWVFIAT